MPYLRYRDYTRTIQDANFLQIIASDDSLRLDAEVAAQAEVVGYLSQKYDTAKEFTNTTKWSPLVIYKAFNLVYLDFTTYSATAVYAINDLINFTDGKCYICIAVTTAGQNPTTNPAKWTLLGTRYDMFNIVPTKPEFSYLGYYTIGNQVYWKDKIYTALLPTPALDHTTALQYGKITSLPARNIFPDDPLDGAKYWGAGVAFQVAAGTLPTNAAWTAGDNRSQMLVQKTIDVCLYHLHSRISPNNIPKLRIDRYNAATSYLNSISLGVITADIPLIQPKTNGMIRFGSDVRRQNDY